MFSHTQEDDYDYWKEKICYRHRFLLVGSELCLQLSSYPVRRKTILLSLLLHFPAFPKPRSPRRRPARARKLRRRKQRRCVRCYLLELPLPSIFANNEQSARARWNKALAGLLLFQPTKRFRELVASVGGEATQHTQGSNVVIDYYFSFCY